MYSGREFTRPLFKTMKNTSKNIFTKSVKIFGTAFSFRIIMFIMAAFMLTLSGKSTGTFEGFLQAFNKWDVLHYIDVARNGYLGSPEICEVCKAAIQEKGVNLTFEEGQHLFLVFFPLYPVLIRVAGAVFGNYIFAALFISVIFYSLGCVYLYKLVACDHSLEVAENIVILTSLSPFAFFFGGAMTEGLFLFLSAACLYYCRKHEWWQMIAFGAVASMCRAQGLLLTIPAFVELCMEHRPIKSIRENNIKKFNIFVLRCLSCVLMLSGFVVYLVINKMVEGYAFAFSVYQGSHWNNKLVPIWECLKILWANAFKNHYGAQLNYAMWIPELVVFAISVALLVYGAKKLRPMHWWYGLVYLIICYSSSWLISGGRYMACCLPLFIIVAEGLKKKPRVFAAVVIVSTMFMTLFFYGYLSGLHIM